MPAATELPARLAARPQATTRPATAPLLGFFALAFGLSWAWLLPLALSGDVVRRGDGWPTHIPALLGPLLAALIMLSLREGRAGVREWLAAVVRWPRARRRLAHPARASRTARARPSAGTLPDRATAHGSGIVSQGPVPLSRGALALRSAHAAISLGFLSAIAYVWWCGLTRRRGRLLATCVAALTCEGVAVAANGGDCPLGGLQQRVGDPVPLFELVLSPRAAKRAVPALGAVATAGIALVALHRPPTIAASADSSLLRPRSWPW